MIASSVAVGERFRSVTKWTSVVVRPMEASTKLRKNADKVMSMIMPVVRRVASNA
ncbi:hypothetical protein D3C80_1406130 [compost metagenome]